MIAGISQAAITQAVDIKQGVAKLHVFKLWVAAGQIFWLQAQPTSLAHHMKGQNVLAGWLMLDESVCIQWQLQTKKVEFQSSSGTEAMLQDALQGLLPCSLVTYLQHSARCWRHSSESLGPTQAKSLGWCIWQPLTQLYNVQFRFSSDLANVRI